MKVVAEERKQKTDQLLLTAPVSVGKIIMGKYLALLAVFLIPVAIICTYPLILENTERFLMLWHIRQFWDLSFWELRRLR